MLRVVHNGMDIHFCNNMSEVNKVITDVLAKYESLNPKLEYNYKVGNAIFLCYRYHTLYCEMFLIEEEK